MKPDATLEAYQTREKFLISYIKSQITKLEHQENEEFKWFSDKTAGKRSAYKDILYKLEKDSLGN